MEALESLFRATTWVKELAMGKRISVNGWECWHVGKYGPSFPDIRSVRFVRAETPDLKSVF